MNPMVHDAERLGDRRYVGTMDRSRVCNFCIESKRFEERRQTHGVTFALSFGALTRRTRIIS